MGKVVAISKYVYYYVEMKKLKKAEEKKGRQVTDDELRTEDDYDFLWIMVNDGDDEPT